MSLIMKKVRGSSHENPALKATAARSAQTPAPPGEGQKASLPAATVAHTDIGKMLLQSGSNVDTVSDWGDTLLTIAARSQDAVLVDELIRFKADVNLTNASGQSALMLAGNHTGIVHSLLRAKADPAHAANQNAVLSAVLDKNSDIAQLLLFMGASPNATDPAGKSSLTHATEQANISLVGCLLAAKADPNAGSHQHALAYAVASPNPALLQTMLDAGAFPDLNGVAGQNAIILAFELGRADAVAQWFPAHAAREAEAFKEGDWSLLALAVKIGTPKIVEVVRDAGYRADVTDEFGYTLLMLASHRGQVDIVKDLLQPRHGQPGADPDAKAHSDNKTALMFAAAKGHASVLAILLAAGADPNAVDDAGFTAMEHAQDCTDQQQRNEVEFMLAEAMAARALQCAGQAVPVYASLDDFLRMQQKNAAQGNACAGDDDPSAWSGWTRTMDDIDEFPATMELETGAILPPPPDQMI